MMRQKARGIRFWARTVMWGAALLLLIWTLRAVPIAHMWETLVHIRPDILIALMVLNVVILWFFGGRGWVILRALGHRIPYRAQVVYRLAAFSVNYFTPGPQFGGEPLHVYSLVRGQGVPWENAMAAVAVDRLFEFSVNIAFLLAGIGVLLALDMLPAGTQGPLIGGVGVLALLPLAYLFALARGNHPLRYLMKHLQRWKGHIPLLTLGEHVVNSEALAVRLFREHPGTLVSALGISLVTWGLLIGEYALMIRALGIHLQPVQVIAVMAAARLAFLFPTPGGLGALEAGQAMAMKMFGYDPALGLTISLLIRARDILVGLAGIAVYGWYTTAHRNRLSPHKGGITNPTPNQGVHT